MSKCKSNFTRIIRYLFRYDVFHLFPVKIFLCHYSTCFCFFLDFMHTHASASPFDASHMDQCLSWYELGALGCYVTVATPFWTFRPETCFRLSVGWQYTNQIVVERCLAQFLGVEIVQIRYLLVCSGLLVFNFTYFVPLVQRDF